MSIENYGAPYPANGEIIDGKYEVQHILGEGGMGAVAKATHLLRRAPVALKFLSPSVLVTPGAVERFLNEAVAASQIDSAHVVTIYDVGKLPSGAPYLVMEFLEGRDLAMVLEQIGGPLDVPRAVHFVLQILRAMQAAHAVGIIHRDLKPANCFAIHRDGDDDFVKLFDFGISKIQKSGETKSASLTRTNSALGTPLYMSPEQAKSPRSVDTRTDLYSTAVILYELLTCCTPYYSEAGELTEILFKLFTQDPTPILQVRPDLPPALAEVIHKCLARDLDTRPPTAADMAELLAPFADDRSKLIIERIRHPPPPKKSSAPPGGSGQGSLAAFEKMSSPGNIIVGDADRRAIGQAATQISVVPAAPLTNQSPPSMVRESGPMGAAAAAQSELDSTKNSTMTATQALASGSETSRFPAGIVLCVMAALAIGTGIYMTHHSTDPLARDSSPVTSASATANANANSIPTDTASTIASATAAPSASTSPSASASAAPHSTTHAVNPPPSATPENIGKTPSPGINHLNDIGRKQ
ncbi:MAG: serine/threonine-protein kinase [Polyangiaceae bacterium]